jgi:hypothetical protein
MNTWCMGVLFVLLAGGLAAYLLARFLMLRGFRDSAVGAGFVLLATIVGWGICQQAQTWRLGFNDVGPCLRAPEVFDAHGLGWRLYGAIALVLYLVFSYSTMSRLPAGVPASPSPAHKRWMAIVLVVAGAAIIAGVSLYQLGISRRNQLERASLLTEMHQVHDVITTAHLRELGSVRLSSAPQSPLSEESPYVDPGGLRFSGDGRWLSLQYSGKVELWRVADLKVGRSFGSGLVAFSPDGSMLAISGLASSGSEALFGYALRDDLSGPVWQVPREHYTPIFMAFSADSRELILSEPEGVVSLDARTGEALAGSKFALLQGFGAFVLSPYGEYLAADNNLVAKVYERRGGRLVSEFEFPPELSCWTLRGEIMSGELSFLPDNNLLLWNDMAPGDVAVLWDIETSTGMLMPKGLLSHGVECGFMALSPDSRLAVLNAWDGAYLYDMATHSKSGNIPVEHAVTALAFSPDQRLLAVGTADGRLRFFAADQ